LFAESAIGACGLSEFVARVARAVDGAGVADVGVQDAADLLERFAAVGDGRSDVGRDHPVAVVLTLAATAVVCGIRSFAAIAGHVADVPAALVAQLYQHAGSSTAVGPSKTTIWRVLTGADAVAVDAAVGGWLDRRRVPDPDAGDDAPLVGIGVDGKAVRGARNPGDTAPHLLAAATHDGLVLAQTDVGAKTNEITCFAGLLDEIDIAGCVVTADALHTQREHARYLRRREADFVFCVKGNQPNLYDALDDLPWPDQIGHLDVARGHGRIATRDIRVLPAPDGLPFPHVGQVFLIERHVTDLAGKTLSHLGVLGITSLDADRAGPADIAGLVRGQWGIEVIHWKRDAIFREDDSRVRTGSGPRVMAALRNLAIGALYLHGRNDTAEATRWAARRPERPFQILGLAS
jgi:predicted transposase YbfD/YdcC